MVSQPPKLLTNHGLSYIKVLEPLSYESPCSSQSLLGLLCEPIRALDNIERRRSQQQQQQQQRQERLSVSSSGSGPTQQPLNQEPERQQQHTSLPFHSQIESSRRSSRGEHYTHSQLAPTTGQALLPQGFTGSSAHSSGPVPLYHPQPVPSERLNYQDLPVVSPFLTALPRQGMATQVLPTAQSHFASYPTSYNPSMFASLPSYSGTHGDAYHTYQPQQPGQQMYMVSRQGPTTEDLMGRPPPLSPHAQMRIPPRRDRTPIGHHRPSVSRPRSHSRSELIMAYATDQRQSQPPPPAQPSMTVVPSQSAPTTPQIFSNQSAYAMPSADEPYTDPSSYFPSGASPPTSLPDFGYQSEPQFQTFYQLGRSASHSTSAGMSMNPQDAMYLSPQSQQPQRSLPRMDTVISSFPPIQAPLESSPGDLEILSSRPKPQCWDHGCNGRQFSTFSNLLRHQREKSGSAMKAICPYCGIEFTRSTARNGHMYGGKCKGRPESEKAASDASTMGSTSGKEQD